MCNDDWNIDHRRWSEKMSPHKWRPKKKQWGSEIRTGPDFKWSQLCWFSNGPNFEWIWNLQAQPFDTILSKNISGFWMVHFSNGQVHRYSSTIWHHFVKNHLKSEKIYQDFEWSIFQMVMSRFWMVILDPHCIMP